MDAHGIWISNKKPKIFCHFATSSGGVERDRREGKHWDERGPQEKSCGAAAKSLNTALFSSFHAMFN